METEPTADLMVSGFDFSLLRIRVQTSLQDSEKKKENKHDFLTY